jgi:acetolactate synthase-1/2/3 large subunit
MLNDDVATVLARSDYHAVVQGFGAAGLVIRSVGEVEPVLQHAREIARGGKPVLVNVWLDRNDFREGSISM